jgi:hypothetical protein
MTLLRRAPREVYRVYGEEEFFTCATNGEHMELATPATGVRRLYRIAGATMVLAAMGAVGALVAIASRSAAGDGRRVGAGLLAATGSLASSRGARTHVLWRGSADADGPRHRGAPARPADRARQVELARQIDRARSVRRASARPRANVAVVGHASAPIEPALQASVAGVTTQASAESRQPEQPAPAQHAGQSEFGFER